MNRQASQNRLTQQDVTASQSSEDKLLASDAAYRTLLNASLNAAFLIDTSGVVLAVNEQGAKRLGHRPDEVLGRNLQQFLPADAGNLRKEMGMRAVQQGEAVRFEDEIDGAILEHLLFPVFDKRGVVTQLAIYSIDITDRKASDEERKRLQAQLQQAQKIAKNLGYPLLIKASAGGGGKGTQRYVAP